METADKPEEAPKGEEMSEAVTEQVEEIIDGITASHGAHMGQVFGVMMKQMQSLHSQMHLLHTNMKSMDAKIDKLNEENENSRFDPSMSFDY